MPWLVSCLRVSGILKSVRLCVISVFSWYILFRDYAQSFGITRKLFRALWLCSPTIFLLEFNGKFVSVSMWFNSWKWDPNIFTHGMTAQLSCKSINSLRPSDAYLRQQSRPSLVQIMACRLAGAKPLSEPKMEYCWLHPWEQTSVKYWSKLIYSHSQENAFENVRKMHGGHFVSASMC